MGLRLPRKGGLGGFLGPISVDQIIVRARISWSKLQKSMNYADVSMRNPALGRTCQTEGRIEAKFPGRRRRSALELRMRNWRIEILPSWWAARETLCRVQEGFQTE